MCGIAGVVGDRALPSLEELEAASALLALRGPDGHGEWKGEGVALAHRRLAILDLSDAGRQPMLSDDGRFVIVFNGEIYNHKEIREQLSGPNLRWKGGSDTETLLAAYARWGSDCVTRLRGMFAFAVWDAEDRALFMARDRMGVKPLYYCVTPGGQLAFGSRPNSVLALLPSTTPGIDRQALRFYLELGYVPGVSSIFESVRKLAPGHTLTWKGGRVETDCYWDYASIVPTRAWHDRREDELLDELDELVTRSVRSRLISDVPLGVFLSGGIDSSLVTAVMSKIAGGSVSSFSIGFDNPRFDESRHAEAVAAHLGTNHRTETLGVNDLLDLLPQFLSQFDEPFFDSSAFPTLAVSRMARQHVTVALSGDGGDELFGGYHYYSIIRKLAVAYRMPTGGRRLGAAVLSRAGAHKAMLLAGALKQGSLSRSFAFMRSMAKDFPSLLLDDIRQGTRGPGELFEERARQFAGGLDASEIGMRLDMSFTLPDDYLQKVDGASMAFSLEAREPLLDHELIEWALSLPVAWKLRESTGKYLLRKLAYRYVPSAILNRPKQGFEIPLAHWISGPLRTWVEERFHDSTLCERVGVSQEQALKVLAMHLAGTRNVAPLIWAATMLLEFGARHPGVRVQ